MCLFMPAINVNSAKSLSGHKMAALRWEEHDSNQAESNFGSLVIERETLLLGHVCNQTALWNGSIDKGLVCGLNPRRKSSCNGENCFMDGCL